MRCAGRQQRSKNSRRARFIHLSVDFAQQGTGPSRVSDGACVWLPDMGRINRDDQGWEEAILRGEPKV